ncbi:MAG TPA: hypothetical protein VMJ10_15160 [Kofleriaceae bacterium]|nr:hypothetical protein [Kofleriaceae bacterium]
MVRAWAQIRAGAIAVALVAGAIDGCPADAVRGSRPVAWIEQHLRVTEWWAIYQHPGGMHYRMWIEGDAGDGTWRLLYRAGDGEHVEDADLLDSARVWGAYTPSAGTPPQYNPFCAWIIARMLARHPELARVRVRLEQVELDHGEMIPSGTFEYAIARGRR